MSNNIQDERFIVMEVIIKIHDCARSLEKEFGPSALSEELRSMADKISRLVSPMEVGDHSDVEYQEKDDV